MQGERQFLNNQIIRGEEGNNKIREQELGLGCAGRLNRPLLDGYAHVGSN